MAGQDPVRLGFVASVARPGGNLIGVNFLNNELEAKHLALLREVVPPSHSRCCDDQSGQHKEH
jgi:putative ABC transport system substrate-binding protein